MPDDNAEAGPSRLPAAPAADSSGAGSSVPPSSVAASLHTAAATSQPYRPQSRFSFPWAAQPEIVRAYQKDAYYRDLFVDQLKDVVRTTLGVRTLHAHSEVIAVLGGVAYFALCALNGAQTLGEEYVNAMMVDGKSGRIARGKRRIAFIFAHALLPYLVAKSYTATRRAFVQSSMKREQALERARLRARAMLPASQRGKPDAVAHIKPTLADRIVSAVAGTLPAMESFTASDSWLAYFGAAHLAIFYLAGRYYSIAQRLANVRYISTIARRPGQRPPSYEVLGVLLGIQIVVKAFLGLRRRRRERRKAREAADAAARAAAGLPPTEKEETSARGQGAADEKEQVVIDGVRWTHSSSPAALVDSEETIAAGRATVPLAYADPDAQLSAEQLGLSPDAPRRDIETAQAAAQGRAMQLEGIAQSVLRCTLCMEQRTPEKGNSAVTECGHVFCWDCISGWAREKPECPLCRQSIAPHRLLPVYNF